MHISAALLGSLFFWNTVCGSHAHPHTSCHLWLMHRFYMWGRPTRPHLSLCVSGVCFRLHRQQEDIILSSSSFLVWGVSMSSLHPSLQALPAAAPFLQGLNLHTLNCRPVWTSLQGSTVVSPGIFRQGHVALWCHGKLAGPRVSVLDRIYRWFICLQCTIRVPY